MGQYLSQLGGSSVLVADAAVLDLIADRVRAVCKAAGFECEPVEFSGEITPHEVDRLTEIARGKGPAFIIGAGGGKGIDAGKAVSQSFSSA
jgi:glycerol dehydrogenase